LAVKGEKEASKEHVRFEALSTRYEELSIEKAALEVESGNLQGKLHAFEARIEP